MPESGPSPHTATAPRGRLTVLQGTAMYVGVVLGTGVIALPALAAEIAGPASLVAWLALVILSGPLAATFAALGARYPDAGGVATFARHAFGDDVAAVVGWCFCLAIPVGAPAVGVWAGEYAADAWGGGSTTVAVTAFGIVVLVLLMNALGLRLAGRVQLALAGVLVAFLLVASLLALPYLDLRNLQPFAPNGWLAVGSAAAVLMWSFVGWEAVTSLTAEFRRPERDVPRATAAAVVVVGVLYLTVAFATVAVLGSGATRAAAPLGDLLVVGLGGDARSIAAAVAILLTAGMVNTYVAGGAKLGAALGRDGTFPTWLAAGSQVGDVPRRSLLLVGTLTLGVTTLITTTDIGTEPFVRMTTGLFVAVYVIGIAAAIRLLPRRTPARAAAFVALPAVLALFAATGVYIIWPVLVAAAAVGYRRWRQQPGP
jgi:amino acid efflux transporter